MRLKLFLYVLSLYLSVNIEYMFGYLYCLEVSCVTICLFGNIILLLWSHPIVTVCRSFVCCSVRRITHKCVNLSRPNMVGIGDPLEVIKFWCQSESGCGLRLLFHFY